MQPDQQQCSQIPKLKDKQKLFSKLFITSSYFPPQNEPPLIVSPMFLNLILHELSSLTPSHPNLIPSLKQYQKSTIEQMLQIISSKLENSLILSRQDKLEDSPVLDSLILQILNLIEHQQDVLRFQPYLKPLTHYYVVTLKNVSSLTKQLAHAFQTQNFNPFQFQFIVKVLHTYFDVKKGLEHLPVSFFYFFGQSSGIKAVSKNLNLSESIKNEFAFVLCFRLTQPQVLSREKLPVLVRFRTNKQEVLAILTNDSLEMHNSTTKKSTKVQFKPEFNKTYRLIINFLPVSTQISINDQNFTTEPLIKKESAGRQFQQIVFGQSFEGHMFSIMFIAKRIQMGKHFIYADFPQGIDAWPALRKLGQKNPKLLQKIVLSWLPFSVFDSRFKMYCFDVFRKNHGELLENAIVMENTPKQDALEALGGFKTIAPLFYLLQFYDPSQSQCLLNELLKIVQVMIVRSSQSLKQFHSSTQIQQFTNEFEQFPNNEAFTLLGGHLSNLGQLMTGETFQILHRICSKLNDDQKVILVEKVLWSVPIEKVRGDEAIKQFYLVMIKIYQNSKSIALKAKGLTDSVYWIVERFERREIKGYDQEAVRKNITLDNIIDSIPLQPKQQPAVHYCCYQHYLNESLLGNFDINYARQVIRNQYSLHYEWLEKIVSILLEYKFLEDPSHSVESIRFLLRFLMKKYSTCFYLLIIKTVKRQLKNLFGTGKNVTANRDIVLTLHSKCHILSFLAFLAQKTVSLDLITQVLQLHLYFHQTTHLTDDQKSAILEFIEKTIKRLAETLNDENPKLKRAKQVRKKSQQLAIKPVSTKIQKQHQSTMNLHKNESAKIVLSQITQPNKELQKILKGRPMALQTCIPLLNLIQNSITGQVSQQALTSSINIKLSSGYSFRLVRVYYESLPRYGSMRIKLLRSIEKYMNCTMGNKMFLMKNQCFLAMVYAEWRNLRGQQRVITKKESPHKRQDNSEEIQQKCKDFTEGNRRDKQKKEIERCVSRIWRQMMGSFSPTENGLSMTFGQFYCTVKKIIHSHFNNESLSLQSSAGPNLEQLEGPKLEQLEGPNLQQLEGPNLQQLEGPNLQQLAVDHTVEQMTDLMEHFAQSVEAVSDDSFYSIELILILLAEKYRMQENQQSENKKLTVDKFDSAIRRYNGQLIHHLVLSFKQKILKNTKQNDESSRNDCMLLQASNSHQLSLTSSKSLDYLTSSIIETYIIQASKNRSSKKIPYPQVTHQIQPPSLEDIFSMQLFAFSQGEIDFIFDIIIPKMTSHFWLLYGQGLELKENVQQKALQSQVLLKDITGKYLHAKTKKNVYLIQLFIDSILQNINRCVRELISEYDIVGQTSKKQNQNISIVETSQLSKYLQQLLSIYNMLMLRLMPQSNKGHQSEASERQTLFRMFTYQISAFLISLIDQSTLNQQLHKMFSQTYISFWANIFEGIFCVINLGKVPENADAIFETYQHLISHIQENSPFKVALLLIDLFRFYLLDRESHQILTINILKQFYLIRLQNQSVELTQKWISDLICCEKFKESVTLNSHMEEVSKKISVLNRAQLVKKYRSVIQIKAVDTASQSSIKSQKQVSNLANSSKSLNFPSEISSTKKLSTNPPIQKLLERQNSLQQESRTVYLYEQQIQMRKFRHLWQKLWQKLRIYHHPYGLWMAMRNSADRFEYQMGKNQVKNFAFQVSRFRSLSGINPILQAKIIEPWQIIKRKHSTSEQSTSLFNDMIPAPHEQAANKKKTLQSKEITRVQAKDFLKMTKILNYVWKLPGLEAKSNNASSKQVFEVVWINQNVKAQGRIHINSCQQIQFWYSGTKQKDSHLTFQKFTLSPNQQLHKTYPLIMVSKIARKRYMMQYHSLEIQFIDSLALLLDFPNRDENQFLKLIDNLRQERIITHGPKLKANKVPLFDSSWWTDNHDSSIDELTDKWKRRQISNLTYLCKLNVLASRSGLDLSQYPVVPWISELNVSKQPKLRDLTKTIGGLGSEERKKALLQKYSSKDPFNPVPAFHYGTHYSSPGVVFNFLVRMYPFTEYLKSLQGGRFDLPDRLFSSLMSSWKSAYNEISDVRELIPEFYYLPEVFINLEGHNFGETQSMDRIHNVEMPEWAANNPYYFVMQFRQMLESQQAWQHLGDWIDLIFGYKQKREEAQKHMNVYYYLTYDQYFDFSDEQDQVHKKSCQAQIVHFGQIPPQLFLKPHPKSNPLKRAPLSLALTHSYTLMNKLSEQPIGIEVSQNLKQMTIIRRNCIDHYSLQKNPVSLLKTCKLNLEKSSSELFYLLKKNTAKVLFFTTLPYFIVSGYMNHQLRIYHKLTGKMEVQEVAQSQILAINISHDETLITVGCANGCLLVYQVEVDGAKVYLHKVHSKMFDAAVSEVSETDGWTMVVFGCYCAIYKISRAMNYLAVGDRHYQPCVEFIRSFKNNSKIIYAMIVTCPLYSLIIIDNASIKSYSINGQFIKQQHCSAKSQPVVIKDCEMNEYVCVGEEERMVVMSTPDLRAISELEVGDYLGMEKRVLVYESKVCVVGW